MADLTRPQLTDEPTFRALQDYYQQHGANINVRQLFNTNPQRFNKLRYVKTDYVDSFGNHVMVTLFSRRCRLRSRSLYRAAAQGRPGRWRGGPTAPANMEQAVSSGT